MQSLARKGAEGYHCRKRTGEINLKLGWLGLFQ